MQEVRKGNEGPQRKAKETAEEPRGWSDENTIEKRMEQDRE